MQQSRVEKGRKKVRKKIKRPDEFLSVIMDTSKESGVFNEDRPPIASHRR